MSDCTKLLGRAEGLSYSQRHADDEYMVKELCRAIRSLLAERDVLSLALKRTYAANSQLLGDAQRVDDELDRLRSLLNVIRE